MKTHARLRRTSYVFGDFIHHFIILDNIILGIRESRNPGEIPGIPGNPRNPMKSHEIPHVSLSDSSYKYIPKHMYFIVFH